jgi:hypothetical protein
LSKVQARLAAAVEKIYFRTPIKRNAYSLLYTNLSYMGMKLIGVLDSWDLRVMPLRCMPAVESLIATLRHAFLRGETPWTQDSAGSSISLSIKDSAPERSLINIEQ